MQKNEAQAGRLQIPFILFRMSQTKTVRLQKNGDRNGQSERAFPTVAKGYTFGTFYEACGMIRVQIPHSILRILVILLKPSR